MSQLVEFIAVRAVGVPGPPHLSILPSEVQSREFDALALGVELSPFLGGRL